jgi:trehalose utilization protein
MAKIRVTVWGENIHEHTHKAVKKVYPKGMHTCIADGLNEATDIKAITATLQQPEHGLTEKVLANTDVLTWWGHMGHHLVEEEIVSRVQRRVLEGMGLIVLHSGHYSKIFKRLMGTTCSLCWREAAEKERIWVCNPTHPITKGIDRFIEIPHTEMYGEPFGIPVPEEQIFITWFEGGEVFRSGNVWKRGNGKIFYFEPGHETFPIYFQKEIKLVLKNAVRYVCQQSIWKDGCPMITAEQTREKIGKK